MLSVFLFQPSLSLPSDHLICLSDELSLVTFCFYNVKIVFIYPWHVSKVVPIIKLTIVDNNTHMHNNYIHLGLVLSCMYQYF